MFLASNDTINYHNLHLYTSLSNAKTITHIHFGRQVWQSVAPRGPSAFNVESRTDRRLVASAVTVAVPEIPHKGTCCRNAERLAYPHQTLDMRPQIGGEYALSIIVKSLPSSLLSNAPSPSSSPLPMRKITRV